MDLHIPILTLLCMAMVGSHAATAPEEYWKAVLPNTPMPGAVWNSLLRPGYLDSIIEPTFEVVGVSTGGGGYTDVGPKKKPVYAGLTLGALPVFLFYVAASEAQLNDPTRDLLFLEKNMKPGSKMALHFPKPTNTATFLPRQEAAALPFSSDRMPEILRKFSVEPGSEEAQVMENTVKNCESKDVQGEEGYCATSLESMIDYATSTLGSNNVKAISTTSSTTTAQNYTVTGVSKAARDDQAVTCHKHKYVHAVYYCHKTKATSAYTVSLVGEDGSVAKAVAVCHKDTSAWNPNHLAFQVLNVKPGSVPVCHFLLQDNIVWVRNN